MMIWFLARKANWSSGLQKMSSICFYIKMMIWLLAQPNGSLIVNDVSILHSIVINTTENLEKPKDEIIWF
jgi:hypothetical protein